MQTCLHAIFFCTWIFFILPVCVLHFVRGCLLVYASWSIAMIILEEIKFILSLNLPLQCGVNVGLWTKRCGASICRRIKELDWTFLMLCLSSLHLHARSHACVCPSASSLLANVNYSFSECGIYYYFLYKCHSCLVTWSMYWSCLNKNRVQINQVSIRLLKFYGFTNYLNGTSLCGSTKQP